MELRSQPDGKEAVVIFKSQSDMSTASQLYKAGANQSLLMEHVACIVPSWTKVLVVTGQISGAISSGIGRAWYTPFGDDPAYFAKLIATYAPAIIEAFTPLLLRSIETLELKQRTARSM